MSSDKHDNVNPIPPQKEPERESSSSSSSPLPPLSLRAAIQSAVQSTNKALASLEQDTERIRTPVVNAIHVLETQGQGVAHRAAHVYRCRRDYAPFLIGGSALLVGGLVGLRRGRAPAAITGSVAGFLTYLGVYEVDVSKLPEHVFGKK